MLTCPNYNLNSIESPTVPLKVGKDDVASAVRALKCHFIDRLTKKVRFSL